MCSSSSPTAPTAAAIACGLLAGARAEEGDMFFEASDPAQEQVSIVAVSLLTVAPVLLVTCIYRYHQTASALWLVLADYLSFVVAAARNSRDAAQPTCTPMVAAEVRDHSKANVDEWLEAAINTASAADPPAEIAVDHGGSDGPSEDDVAELLTPRNHTASKGPEPQQPDFLGATTKTPSEVRSSSPLKDDGKSHPEFEDAEGRAEPQASQQQDCIQALGEACSSSPLQDNDKSSTDWEDAVGPAELEAPQQQHGIEVPDEKGVETAVLGANSKSTPEQELRLAARCEPRPTLVAPTHHVEGLRKRKPPLGCGMLARPRQD